MRTSRRLGRVNIAFWTAILLFVASLVGLVATATLPHEPPAVRLGGNGPVAESYTIDGQEATPPVSLTDAPGCGPGATLQGVKTVGETSFNPETGRLEATGVQREEVCRASARTGPGWVFELSAAFFLPLLQSTIILGRWRFAGRPQGNGGVTVLIAALSLCLLLSGMFSTDTYLAVADGDTVTETGPVGDLWSGLSRGAFTVGLGGLIGALIGWIGNRSQNWLTEG